MIKLNLTAEGAAAKNILNYLENNVSETLANKIINGVKIVKDGKTLINKKDLDGFMSYACKQAQEQSEKGASSACVEDNTVYGWAIHYFEEESIEGKLFNEDGSEYKPVVAKPKNTQKTTYTPTSIPQKPKEPSLFDLLNEEAPQEKIEETTEDGPTEEELDEVVAEEVQNEIAEEERIEMPKPTETKQVSNFYLEYKKIKEKYPTCILAYRIGDFYEILGKLAITIANEFNLTLTGRDCGLTERVPMVGFPYHSAESYFNKICKHHSLIIYENGQITERLLMKNFDAETGEVLNDITTDEEDEVLIQEREAAKAYDKDALLILSDIFGEEMILD